MNEIETRIVQKMIELAKAHGFPLLGIFDGEVMTKTDRPEVIVAHMGNLDEGWVHFGKHDDIRAFAVMLIPGNGNDGRDIIADYSFDDDFELLVMNKVLDYAEDVQEEPNTGTLINPPTGGH
jgi:hypothetical protein